MPRIKAIVEIGPHQGSPYSNWGVYEIGPDSFENPVIFESEFSDIKEVLDDVDTGDSPFGEFSEQVRDFINDSAMRLVLTEVNGLSVEKRRDFVFPYDQAHRELRDQELEVPEGSLDPMDLSVSVRVFTIEEDY